jgi:hypothetical protein
VVALSRRSVLAALGRVAVFAASIVRAAELASICRVAVLASITRISIFSTLRPLFLRVAAATCTLMTFKLFSSVLFFYLSAVVANDLRAIYYF